MHRALHRPNLFLNCERELVMTLILFTSVLVFSALNLIATVVGVVLWIVGYWGLRQMAKRDSLMSKVYGRQLKYRRWYPSRSTPYRGQ